MQGITRTRAQGLSEGSFDFKHLECKAIHESGLLVIRIINISWRILLHQSSLYSILCPFPICNKALYFMGR